MISCDLRVILSVCVWSSELARCLLSAAFSRPQLHSVALNCTQLIALGATLYAQGVFIILFSTIGILGDFLADPPNGIVGKGDPAGVARKLCGVTFGLMNMIVRELQPARDCE